MKKFNYETLNNFKVNNEIINKLTKIHDLRGQITSYKVDYHETLNRLIEVAKVQSTDSSNRIEGIYTTDSRLKKILSDKTKPKNRNESEILGYRDVLKIIHERYKYIQLNSSNILSLHKILFSYTESSWGGKFKDSDNKIVTRYPDGHEEIRFDPPAAYLVPSLIDSLCTAYNTEFSKEEISPLLLSGAFVFDFVSIHPFKDGNGRMSRLLMLLTLYKSGFDVGKYISLEKIIENTKGEYYEALKESSIGWHSNENDYVPFLNYYLSIILKAYRELKDRVGTINHQKLPVEDLIVKTIQQELRPLSRRELVSEIPQYSEITIKRALVSLQKLGKIKKIGNGKSTKYGIIEFN